MAADILLYNPSHVPVGEDQKQHLELARNIAQRFNHHFRETFIIPEPIIPNVAARVMALGDPSKKMSKSDSTPANTIYLLDTPEKITKKIKRAVTDSEGTIAFDEKREGISNLVSIYAAMSEKSIEQVVQQFSGAGYAPFKTELADMIIDTFRPIREHYAAIRHDENYLLKCLKQGAEKARAQASKTLSTVYDAVGFVQSYE